MTNEAKAGVSLEEAVESLTVAEVEAIERHYNGKSFPNQMSGTNVANGVVWALERRRLQGQADRPDWAAMDGWTLKQLNAYFEEDEIEVDAADPESPSGKGDSEPV